MTYGCLDAVVHVGTHDEVLDSPSPRDKDPCADTVISFLEILLPLVCVFGIHLGVVALPLGPSMVAMVWHDAEKNEQLSNITARYIYQLERSSRYTNTAVAHDTPNTMRYPTYYFTMHDNLKRGEGGEREAYNRAQERFFSHSASFSEEDVLL